MSALDLEQSRSLLLQVVRNLYDQRHGSVPGAVVKAQLIREAVNQSSSFDEKGLGFRGFLDFAKATHGVTVQLRPGSDVLLAPSDVGEPLLAYAHPLPRIRRDFWRAFIEFPVEGAVRLYDATEDKIFYENDPTHRPGVIIEPISRETQLSWRRQFAEGQTTEKRDELISVLARSGNAPFNDFARHLRENPLVMKVWNRYLQKLLTDHVAAWALAHNISPERWSAGTSSNGRVDQDSATPSLGQRAELYNFFDNLPIENLLELRVPLAWLLKATRDKQ